MPRTSTLETLETLPALGRSAAVVVAGCTVAASRARAPVTLILLDVAPKRERRDAGDSEMPKRRRKRGSCKRKGGCCLFRGFNKVKFFFLKDHIYLRDHITLTTIYCYNCSRLLLTTAVGLLLCLIYKVGFLTGVHGKRTGCTGFGPIVPSGRGCFKNRIARGERGIGL